MAPNQSTHSDTMLNFKETGQRPTTSNTDSVPNLTTYKAHEVSDPLPTTPLNFFVANNFSSLQQQDEQDGLIL
ncbi:DNA-binding protein [Prunus dulcis]|uniref:DNA-binding protein n=1 Tax=Prunus dulcis TaxID=3755 RepID=A0A5H2Y451_PRUDU|nr:DNA-binding protein [Prunus dulcis]